MSPTDSRLRLFHNPFFQRPWMVDTGAAAAEGKPADAPKAAKKGVKGFKGIVAGGITGGIEVLITYPTEYVKTQLQLDEKHGAKIYNGILDCVKKTIKKDGFFGLYRGLSVLLYGSIPKSAVRFGAFETLKGHMVDEKGVLTPTGRVLCGLGAGVLEALIIVTPMELVKVKFIDDRRSKEPRYKGFLHGVATIIKEDGLGGLYKGVTATVLKQGTNQAMRFFMMETLKNMYTEGDPKKSIPKYVIGLFGMTAGAVSVFGNTPLDVVKTRMQGLDAAKYKNTFDCIAQIWKQEGFSAFYKGTIPRLSRVCLDVAITFTVYEVFMDLINMFWP